MSRPITRPTRPRQWLLATLLGTLSTGAGAQVTDLMRVYELATTADPTYQSAIAENRAAQEFTPQARANLLPTLSAQGSGQGNRLKSRRANLTTGRAGTTNFNSHDYSINLRQPLYRYDRWLALDQAQVQVDQADARLAFERQDLMLRAAQRYFDLLRAADRLTFAVAEMEAFGQQLEQSRQRFEVGLIAITDVEEAKAGFDLARAQVIQAESELDNAREALREVTGQYHDEIRPLGEQMPLETPEPDDIDRWTETALDQNLQLIGQRYQADVARRQIGIEESGHLPSLDLVASHGRLKSGGGSLGGRDEDSSVVGVEVNVPIFSGFSVVSRTRQSRHLYQQQLDETERVRRAVQRQTRDAFLGVRSGISRVGALAQAVRSNESAVEATEAGFQVGTRTTVDVLNAQRDLFGARRDYAESRYDYIVNILALKQAAGTLDEEDLQLVNSWLE
jgi:outer membrane protein